MQKIWKIARWVLFIAGCVLLILFCTLAFRDDFFRERNIWFLGRWGDYQGWILYAPFRRLPWGASDFFYAVLCLLFFWMAVWLARQVPWIRAEETGKMGWFSLLTPVFLGVVCSGGILWSGMNHLDYAEQAAAIQALCWFPMIAGGLVSGGVFMFRTLRGRMFRRAGEKSQMS